MTIAAPPPVAFEHSDDHQSLVVADPERVRFLYVPFRRYLMIDGSGGPPNPTFQDAIGTLYPVGYTLHFTLRERGVSAPVGALEGLYWIGQPGPIPLERFSTIGSPDEMSWRLLLPVPDEATEEEIGAAIEQMRLRRSGPPPALDRLVCHGWLEGDCAQILHIGPYDAEALTMERLLGAVQEAGLRPRGCHHEIYMSGPGTAPHRTKTILRHPVEEVAW